MGVTTSETTSAIFETTSAIIGAAAGEGAASIFTAAVVKAGSGA